MKCEVSSRQGHLQTVEELCILDRQQTEGTKSAVLGINFPEK
jgi:hypothetical protein